MTTTRQVTHNSHFNTPCRNRGIIGAPHETVINIIDACDNFRFRVASCAEPEHSTLGATAHSTVAVTTLSPARPNRRTHKRERSQRHHDSSYAPHALSRTVEGRVG